MVVQQRSFGATRAVCVLSCCTPPELKVLSSPQSLHLHDHDAGHSDDDVLYNIAFSTTAGWTVAVNVKTATYDGVEGDFKDCTRLHTLLGGGIIRAWEATTRRDARTRPRKLNLSNLIYKESRFISLEMLSKSKSQTQKKDRRISPGDKGGQTNTQGRMAVPL